MAPVPGYYRRYGLRIIRDVFSLGGVLDFHIAELFRFKNLATLQALDEFLIFVPGDDSNLRMSAGGGHLSRVWAFEKSLFPPDCNRLLAECKLNFTSESRSCGTVGKTSAHLFVWLTNSIVY